MWFMLYGPDTTPLDTTDGNELLCVVKYEARNSRTDDFPWWNVAWTQFSELSSGELAQFWDSMVSSTDRTTLCVELRSGARDISTAGDGRA